MRTIINKLCHSFLWLAFIFIGFANFSFAADTFSSEDDSLLKPEKDYRDTITSTFGYHFYQRKIIGESSNTYKNMGAVLDMRKDYNGMLNSGLDNYYSFLYLNSLPVDSTSVSYITYVTGSKDEQIFAAGFMQKMFRNFAVNGHYRNIVSPGFYQRQSNKIRNFSAGLSYVSPNNFYRGEINFAHSKLTEQQNGGITTDTTLSTVENNQGKSLAVNLMDADLSLKRKNFALKNEFRFQQHKEDSVVHSSNVFRLNKISQRTDFNRKYYIYYSSSTNPDFYQNVLLDTLSTYDSVYISNLHNELSFTFDIGNSGSKLNLLYANELIDYNLQENKNQFFINQVAADLVFKINSFNVASQFTYKYEEILKSGYFFNLHLEKESKGFIDRVFINSLSKSDYPSLIADSYTSNHFIWRSEFENVKQNKVSAGLFLKDEIAGLSVSGLNIGDYIYYDVNALPVQYNDDIKVISVDLTIKYNFYKNWTFYNESSFQSADKNKIYPVPDLTAYSCIYYERDYFKKALMASIGIGCNYFTAYYANAFMPATSQFYLQQEHKIGNYPYFDFFANIRVRTAKFFIRVEHFNKGLSDDNYFYLPLQPTPGRTLKVGLNWNFSEVLYK